MTRAEAKAKEMGVSMNEVYDFIKKSQRSQKGLQRFTGKRNGF